MLNVTDWLTECWQIESKKSSSISKLPSYISIDFVCFNKIKQTQTHSNQVEILFKIAKSWSCSSILLYLISAILLLILCRWCCAGTTDQFHRVLKCVEFLFQNKQLLFDIFLYLLTHFLLLHFFNFYASSIEKRCFCV